MPTCAKGKRVSKGKTGNTKALMIICGGWCIGRSPGAKEWIAEDLPKYDPQRVGTKNQGRPPNFVTYTEFAYECQDTDGTVLSSFKHVVESKNTINAQDWPRAEINKWLNDLGILMDSP